MDLGTFKELKVIFENAQTQIRKGELNGLSYALKFYKNSNSFKASKERLEREKYIYEKIKDVTVHAFEDEGVNVLAKPYCEGITLLDFINDWNFDQLYFLKLAIKITEVLQDIHGHQVLHLDINPSNIIFDPANERMNIIDFASASLLKHKSSYLGNPEKVECDLHYISPEQTGRINRVIDFSSDLYSFGAVLYELATGRKMFKSLDPLELIHNHVAKEPTNPSYLNPELHPQVENIILKLLAKDSEDRYQSARGLLHDLQQCYKEYSEKGVVPAFPLGEMDMKDEFRISQKLYGRENELHILNTAFRDVSKGAKKLVLLSGKSGTGKSNLVSSVQKNLTRYKGIFVQGKFDQVNRNLPYSAWVESFNNFVELIITQSETEIDVWRQKLKNNLGDKLPYLAQIVPNLNWLFDDIQNVRIEINAETQNRLRYAIKSLFETIADKDHPLVVFIDDWQWSDKASINLLKSLSEDSDLTYLYLIAAYRGNEITEDHLFYPVESRLEKHDEAIKISISNLKKSDTLQLVRDSLFSDDESVAELNEIIYNRTGGNAFFFVQFLNTLYDEGVLQLNHDKGKWEWDPAMLSKVVIPENIVDLMVTRIIKLNELQKKLLKTASCIGGTFELSLLSEILQLSSNQIENLLKQSLSDGLIASVGSAKTIAGQHDYRKSEFRFAHDRIQQGIYAMLSEAEKAETHFRIGEKLVERLGPAERERNIFAIVEQLNKGNGKISKSISYEQLANFNFIAGERAKIIADFENAMKYTKIGIHNLKQLKLDDHLKIYIKLLLQQYELSFLIKDYKDDGSYEGALKKVKLSPYEEAHFHRIKVNGLLSQGEIDQAIKTGLNFLDKKGMKFKRNPSKIDIVLAAISTSRSYNKKKIHELINLPIIEDPFTLELFEIVQLVNNAAYFSNQNLWVLMNIQTAKMHTKMGLCPMAGLTFNAYGAILIISTNDTDSGIAFGKLSIDIFNKFKTQRDLNKALFGYHVLISWWEIHARDSFKGVEDALDLSLAAGDFIFVGHCCNVLSGGYITCGNSVEDCMRNTKRLDKLLAIAKDYTNMSANRIHAGYFEALTDLEYATKVINDRLDGLEIMKPNEDDPDILFYNFYSTKIKLSILLENYAEAYENIKKLLDLKQSSYGTYISIHTDFFIGLSLAFYKGVAPSSELPRIRSLTRKYEKIFKLASVKAPINFANKYRLILAAEALAIKDYDKALKEALLGLEYSKSNRFKFEEAIAWDLCARAYKGLGVQGMANHCIEFMYETYLDYGAYTATTRIEQMYPWVKQKKLSKMDKPMYSSGSLGSTLANIDIKTIFKSSALLAAETDYKRLSTKLVQIAVQNAAAEHGFLILKSGDDLFVRAYGDVDNNVKVYENENYLDFANIPHKVLSYVDKTNQFVILEDAAKDAKFGDDPYFEKHKTRSVFALPIVNKSNLTGILYLENNRTRNAFTSDRVELLKLLMGQIAISIENASLFESMEEKVRTRTLEIQQERDNSEKLLLNILPKSTAMELKETGKAEPRYYKEISVLFLDFKNFSGTSKKLEYRDLINQLDLYFKGFDDIIDKYHIEKIKTIGDAYMCACGLPIERNDHALMMCRAALEMQDMIDRFKEERHAKGQPYFEARIGIHSGPVVAGVVGSKKFAYDIWGDTVNIASRMETACEVGQISISDRTYKLVKDDIECIHIGQIQAKHNEMLETYALKR